MESQLHSSVFVNQQSPSLPAVCYFIFCYILKMVFFFPYILPPFFFIERVRM
uniref:Uncharacterized protein n=1 Tax=Octopus bimaculoides TaxID=37653 RepID=A0A0L8FLL1_OCTBM